MSRSRGNSFESEDSSNRSFSRERRLSDELGSNRPSTKRGLLRRVFSKSSQSTSNLSPSSKDAKGETETSRFTGSWNVKFDKKGNLILADYKDNHVRMIKASDIVVLFPDLKTANRIHMKELSAIIKAGLARGGKNMTVENVLVSHPSGIALDPRGGIFLADTFNHRICEITPKGTMSTLAGNNESKEGREDGREGWRASFSFPRGMATDREGNVVIADWGSHLIRQVTTKGGTAAITTTLAGNPKLHGFKEGEGLEARFYRPVAVAVDTENNILVADSKNNRIRKITKVPVPATAGSDVMIDKCVTSTFAGSDKAGNADGRNPTFNRPIGVAVAPDGSVVVADQGSNQIRVISPLGFTFSATDGHVFDRPCCVDVDLHGNVVVIDHLDTLYILPAGLLKELEQKFENEFKAPDGSMSRSVSNSLIPNYGEDGSARPSSDGFPAVVSKTEKAEVDPERASMAMIRCRICREPTDNQEPLCPYHITMSGGLVVTTEFKDKDEKEAKAEETHELKSAEPSVSSDPSVDKRPSHSDTYSSHRVHVMEKTKDMLAALSTRNLDLLASGRGSMAGSYAERIDTRALLVADPTLERLLVVPMALHFFARFLISEHSEENIEFWESVTKWVNDCDLGMYSNDALLEEAKSLIAMYVGEDAPRQVNLNSAMVAQVRAAERIHDPSLKILEMRDALVVCKAAVTKLLGEDGFRRFLKSSLWQEFLSATQEIRVGQVQTVHLPNGDLYVGDLKDGKFHGQGVMTYHNGDLYTGKFKDGTMHGVGELRTKKGRFVGEFSHDLKHGEGTLYNTENDDFIQGVWVKDKLAGAGKMHEKGKIYEAVWVEGEVVCKVERRTERMLGTYYAEHISGGSRKVYCTVDIEGVVYGYSKGRHQETGTVSWSLLDEVNIDLLNSQVLLRFIKNGQQRTIVIQPCEPMTTTRWIIERADFLEKTSANPSLIVVEAKALFARIDNALKNRREHQQRLVEVRQALEAKDDTEDRSSGKERQRLQSEEQQLATYLDTSLLLADMKDLRELLPRIGEQKPAPSPTNKKGMKLSLRKPSPSPRRGGNGKSDDSSQVEDLIGKAQALLSSHQIA